MQIQMPSNPIRSLGRTMDGFVEGETRRRFKSNNDSHAAGFLVASGRGGTLFAA